MVWSPLSAGAASAGWLAASGDFLRGVRWRRWAPGERRVPRRGAACCSPSVSAKASAASGAAVWAGASSADAAAGAASEAVFSAAGAVVLRRLLRRAGLRGAVAAASVAWASPLSAAAWAASVAGEAVSVAVSSAAGAVVARELRRVVRRLGVGVASATSEEAAASDTAGVFSCVINILLDRQRRRNLSAVIPTEGTGRTSGKHRMACP